jgi:hypothetical protein
MHESSHSRKIIGFDAFGKFPSQPNELDQTFVRHFETHAGNGISIEELHAVCSHKNIQNYELIQGDVLKTLPEYVQRHPELKIALLHIDVDVYEPSKAALEHLYHRIVPGGLLVLDDYGTVEGETRAVDEFFQDQNIVIEKLPLSHIPAFVRKK